MTSIAIMPFLSVKMRYIMNSRKNVFKIETQKNKSQLWKLKLSITLPIVVDGKEF
jgi:hypothetical protein